MPAKRDRIISKIRGLVNRAQHPVPGDDGVDHEANSAMDTAKKLMLQYGIEQHELEGVFVEDGPGGETVVTLALKVPDKWVLSLAISVADYFSARVHYIEATSHQEGQLTYYGIQTVSEVAAHGFESCLNEIQRAADSYTVRRELWEKHPIRAKAWPTFEDYTEAAKSEMCFGIVTGLARRWKEEREKAPYQENKESTALAINEDHVADSWLAKREVEVEERTVKQPQYHTGDGHHLAGEYLSRFIAMHAGLGAAVK